MWVCPGKFIDIERNELTITSSDNDDHQKTYFRDVILSGDQELSVSILLVPLYGLLGYLLYYHYYRELFFYVVCLGQYRISPHTIPEISDSLRVTFT